MTDRECLEYIAQILDGKEWNSESASDIAQILREHGLDVRDTIYTEDIESDWIDIYE